MFSGSRGDVWYMGLPGIMMSAEALNAAEFLVQICTASHIHPSCSGIQILR